MLRPPFPLPERILDYGDSNTGKTTNYLNIAKWSQRTQSPAQFYIGDSDQAIPRMLTSYTTLTNIHLTPLFDWPDYTKFLDTIRRTVKPTDWVCIDFIGSAWSAVQAYFTEQVFHSDMGNYFLKARKELANNATSLGALEGWTDWTVINAIYKQWANTLLFRLPCNVFAVAQATQLSNEKKPTEDSQTRNMFLRAGSRPTGQKNLPYQFHTILQSSITPRSGNKTISTIKDRERPEQRGLVINNFAIDYLKNIANWEL